MSPEIAFAAPVGLALLGAVLSLGAEALRRPRLSLSVSAALLAAAGLVGIVASASVSPQRVWTFFVSGAGYSMVCGVVMLLGALASVTGLSAAQKGSSAFGGLVALSAAALAVLAGTTDIIVMVLALETVALCGYALVALARSPRAGEAAMKYFVQGAVATALLILGIAAAVLSGALAIEGGRLASVSSGTDTVSVMVAIALVLAAFAFKLGAFPFHAWAPDAYETAPPEASAFLASAVKVAVLVATYTLLTVVLAQVGLFVRAQWLVAGIATASVVFGNLAALAQRSYTRLLAYSGIAQVGYGLTAVVTGNGNAALVFVTAYAAAAAGAFVVARAYRAASPDWDGSITGMAGFGRRFPTLSAALAVFLLSLTGIPPLFGFWGKFLVFLSTAAPTQPRWVWLAVVGLLGSVVSFGYYGYVLKTVYFDEAEAAHAESAEAAAKAAKMARAATVVAVILALFILVAGLTPLGMGVSRFVGVSPARPFSLSGL
jgi:NADH-quinone oxidoreductase subunit N